MNAIDRDKRFTVLELYNNALKEICFVLLDLPIFTAIAKVREEPPSPITHWKHHANHTEFRSMGFDLSYVDACVVIAEQATRPLEQGWKNLTEMPVP